ncbi:hypothetical protein GUI12_02485 [Anaplasmataceae bacterium AB001_6]|nr:hypothetical protein GUI12_02485 [Anaplasmataceae bacterium AB001_6]
MSRKSFAVLLVIFSYLIQSEIRADSLSKDMYLFHSNAFARVFLGVNNIFNDNLNERIAFDTSQYKGTEYTKVNSPFFVFGGEVGYMFDPLSISFQLDYAKLSCYEKSLKDDGSFIVPQTGTDVDLTGLRIKNMYDLHFSTNFNFTFNMSGWIYFILGAGIGFDSIYFDAFDESDSSFKATYKSMPLSTQLNCMIGIKSSGVLNVSPYLGYHLKHTYKTEIDFKDPSMNPMLEDSKDRNLTLADMNNTNYHAFVIGLMIHL